MVPPVFEIRLLGEPQFRYGDQPVSFGAPARALELLAYLLLHREAPIARERVASALWPDATDDEARTDLRRHAYYLTHGALPTGPLPWIVSDKRTIGWNTASSYLLDVAEFLERGDAEAMQWYRGDLLPRAEGEWLVPLREQLRGRALDRLAALVATREQFGDHAGVQRNAERMLEIDPYREDAIRASMAARVAAGDRTGAARYYTDFKARLFEDLGVEPLPETRKAYHDLDNVARRPVRSNVPVRLTSFVGREREVSDLNERLTQTHLATLFGVGGVGKTRLAQEFARQSEARFPDGIFFSELAPVTDPDFVASAVAGAIGLGDDLGMPPTDAIVNALRDRRALLIVDNCEHVIGAAAQVVERVLQGCARVRVVATSREALRIEGEFVLPVHPLDESASTELFLARAFSAGASIDGDAGVSTICRRLDGLPLAIELAAARVPALGIAEIAIRLDDRLTLLAEGGMRTATPRQQTLSALIDWSYDLLAPSERAAFIRLGVFPTRFSQIAAAAVCDGAAPLASLAAKSLLVAEPESWAMLETTRSYALAKLATQSDSDATYVRMARYALERARVAQDQFRKIPAQQWREEYLTELDTLRAALRYTLAVPEHALLGAQLAAESDMLWWEASLATEGVRWVEQALGGLAADAPLELVSRCWIASAWLQPDGEPRLRTAERALELVTHEPVRDRARALLAFAYAVQYFGERRIEAIAALEEARAIAKAIDDPLTLGFVPHLLGDHLARAGKFDEALSSYDLAIDTYAAVGDARGVSFVVSNLAEIAFSQERYFDALALSRQAVSTINEFGETHFSLVMRANTAMYALMLDLVDDADSILREGYRSVRDAALPLENAVYTLVFAAIAAWRGDIDNAVRLRANADAIYAKAAISRDHTELTIAAELDRRIAAGRDAAAIERLSREGVREPASALIGYING